LLDAVKRSTLTSLQLNDQTQLSPRIQRPLDKFNSAFKSKWLRSLLLICAPSVVPRLQCPLQSLYQDLVRQVATMLGWHDKYLSTAYVLDTLTEVIHDFEANIRTLAVTSSAGTVLNDRRESVEGCETVASKS
jgi:hypothetical protein